MIPGQKVSLFSSLKNKKLKIDFVMPRQKLYDDSSNLQKMCMLISACEYAQFPQSFPYLILGLIQVWACIVVFFSLDAIYLLGV